MHDLASLAASGEEDAFVPREMQERRLDIALSHGNSAEI